MRRIHIPDEKIVAIVRVAESRARVSKITRRRAVSKNRIAGSYAI